MSFHRKMAMPDLQNTLEIFSNIYVEDIIVFPGLKVFISDNSFMFSCTVDYFCRENKI